MSNGLPISIGRPCTHDSQRSLSAPDSRIHSGFNSLLDTDLPMVHSEGTSTPTQLLRHPNIWFGNLPPPPRRPQDNRDFSPLHPLVFPGHHSQLRHVHETQQVQQTCPGKLKLSGAEELPPAPQRQHSLPLHITRPSRFPHHFHARRPDVLPSVPDHGPVLTETKPRTSVRQPRSATRGPSFRPILLPKVVHVHDDPPHSSLRPRGSRSRQLQPTVRRPLLAPNQFHSPRQPPPLSDDPGILGPRPLAPHSTRDPPPRPITPGPSNTHDLRPLSVLPRTSPRRGLLPNPRRHRTSTGHIPPTTTSRPTGPPSRLQRPVHLYQSSPHTPNFRPSSIRKDALLQTGPRLGHLERLGQPANLRTSERSPPTKRRLPRSSEPNRLPKPLPEATLAPSYRHRRPYPLLPNPPAALPSIAYTSSRGKIHHSLPKGALPKEGAPPPPRRLPSPAPRPQLPLRDLGRTPGFPTPPKTPTRTPESRITASPTDIAPLDSDPVLSVRTEVHAPERRTFMDPEALRSALASLPSPPRSVGIIHTAPQTVLPANPPSPTRHLPPTSPPWILQSPVGEDAIVDSEDDSISSFHSHDFDSPSGPLRSQSPSRFRLHLRSPSTSSGIEPWSPASYDYGSAPDTD
uniref:69 kDa protein n=1 Tax=Turnip yellow mosaic virus TaxID=12154 RepID=P69_TYMV|nr:RecName: Full=69 kDa protein; AltName: Full=p69 [Turnip yellow mosaic virus]